jgi:hypothetical protein
MDSSQRNKFIKQLLTLVSDPERMGLAIDLFTDRMAVPSPSKAESKPTNKLSTFWGSTPVWGGIGVLVGAVASQLSLKLLFIAVWAVFVFEFTRVGFFTVRAKAIIGNFVASCVLAVVFLSLYEFSPKPKEPATLDQEADAVVDKAAKKFPWLSSPQKIIVPVSPPAHTIIDFPPPAEIIELPLFPLHVGETPGINVEFFNRGEFKAKVGLLGAVVKVVITSLKGVFKKYKDSIRLIDIGGVINPHTGFGGGHSYYGDPLEKDDIDKLVDRTSALCVVGLLHWQDDTGKYETAAGNCLTRESSTSNTFNWHQLPENNEEHKLQ